MPVSAKVASRISSELKRYQGILTNAKQRDINESDTVSIIQEMLSDVLGYDKFQNVTTEYAIRGTYVDLAVIVDNETRFLIEAKAIGKDLEDRHVRQAVDYAANKGVEWVVLTNGTVWRAYKINFTQPIEKILVFELDVLSANPKSDVVIECFGNLCRECFSHDSMSEFFQQKQITSKFSVATLLLSDSVTNELRLEIRRISGLNVEIDFLKSLLENEVIKRELVDSDDAKDAVATIKKMRMSLAHQKRKKAEDGESGDTLAPNNSQPQLAANPVQVIVAPQNEISST